ncbi:MAG: inositol monophosphatase family protein, partial [Planctomycetota bacterium]|nr:inositol monophosphatase family protein [Planctomycetota bacterium]
MMLDTRELQAIAPRVEEIAREAGQILMGHQPRFRSVRTEFKGLRELVTAADRESEKFIVERLMLDHPEHAILAEEGVLTP